MASPQERRPSKPEAMIIIRDLLLLMQPRVGDPKVFGSFDPPEGTIKIDNYKEMRSALGRERLEQERMIKEGASPESRFSHLQEALARAKTASPYY